MKEHPIDSILKVDSMAPGVPLNEIGVIGAQIANGYVFDEFIPELVGETGRKKYREMRDNCSVISSILFAIEMILRSSEWFVEENVKTAGSKKSKDAKEFFETVLFEDMSHGFDEFIGETLSMLWFGWSYTEIVLKMRIGPDQKNPQFRSNYTDGKYGIRKLANRSQETLDKWEMDEDGDGGIKGMYQIPPLGGVTRYIPIQRALLCRPHLHKGSPEGRSILRGAYTSWHYLKNLQIIEAIAIERELNGLPVGYIPNEILNGTTPEAIAAKNAYVKLVRDIKFNHQAGVLLPSNPYYDSEGNPTNVQQVKFELIASKGTRAIDINKSIIRYQQDIARTILADFVMLGTGERGSYALAKDKSGLFIHALMGWGKSIESVINRHLMPRLSSINGIDYEHMPHVRAGRVAPVDLDVLGKYISDLSGSGMPLFPDDKLEAELRDVADLPEKSDNFEDDLALANQMVADIPEEEGIVDGR